MKTHANLNLTPALAGTLTVLAATVAPLHATRLGSNGVAILSDAITAGGAVTGTFQVVIEDLEDPENSQTLDFQITASVGDLAEPVTETSPAQPPLVSGFAGTLFEVSALALAANPDTLATGSQATLRLTAALHDGSKIVVDPRYAGWQASGPVGLTSPPDNPMLAIAHAVPVPTAATVAATFMRPAPATAAITVQADAADSGVDPDWLVAHGIAAFEPLADDDTDGIPDLLEAVFNFNPNAPDAVDPYEIGTHQESGQDYLKIRFRHNPDNPGIAVTVERATELHPSNFAPTGVVEVSPRTPIDADTEWVTFRSTTPIGGAREFLRIKAVHTGAP
jgi:hypothetical protein